MNIVFVDGTAAAVEVENDLGHGIRGLRGRDGQWEVAMRRQEISQSKFDEEWWVRTATVEALVTGVKVRHEVIRRIDADGFTELAWCRPGRRSRARGGGERPAPGQ